MSSYNYTKTLWFRITSSSVPVGHGKAKVLGIADLLIVEQELLRYELGEIALYRKRFEIRVQERVHRVTKDNRRRNNYRNRRNRNKRKDLTSTERFEFKNRIAGSDQ